MIMLAPDAPPLRKVALRAGKHDSVASVAKRYRVSAAQVAQWNDVGTGARFAPGPDGRRLRRRTRRAQGAGTRRRAAAAAQPARDARRDAAGRRSGSKPAPGTTATAHKHVVAKN